MTSRIVLVLGAAALLSSCDAAMDQVSGQVRTSIVEQCQSVSEGFGIAVPLISPVCECTADSLMQKGADEIAQIDRTRIEEIVRSCADNTGAATTNTTVETTGG